MWMLKREKAPRVGAESRGYKEEIEDERMRCGFNQNTYMYEILNKKSVPF